jgi:lipopolysaccharide/colanic/teichoic acid biosynthesis glycosyltransferase
LIDVVTNGNSKTPKNPAMYRKFGKRVWDVMLAIIGLVLAFPIMSIVMLVLVLVNKGEVFYREIRPGMNEELFKIIKLKTMSDRSDVKGELLPDEQRLTIFGNFLRKTSLDEVPQLINVLCGEMSLVGPRPLRVEYLDLYTDEQKRRHNVKPGITGWAQVNGRNAISWLEKLRLDVWYVDHLTWKLDIKIIILTVLKVFQSDKIYAKPDKSTNRFDGSN